MSILLPNDISQQMLVEKKTKNSKVTNSNSQCSFGTIPRLNDKFPEGDVVLKLGDAGFYNHQEKKLKGAFGLRHIWDKHRTEIGASDASNIITFIENVMTTGAEIIIDNNKHPDKPLIVESSVGMLVIELKNPKGEDPYYSIITAYDRKSHPGTLVGGL